jgi:hypothetical protein
MVRYQHAALIVVSHLLTECTGNSRRCLPDRPGWPILPPGLIDEENKGDSAVLPVLLEENAWPSHYLATRIAYILISEYIGHPVQINRPTNGPKRVFHRTAMPAKAEDAKF